MVLKTQIWYTRYLEDSCKNRSERVHGYDKMLKKTIHTCPPDPTTNSEI